MPAPPIPRPLRVRAWEAVRDAIRRSDVIRSRDVLLKIDPDDEHHDDPLPDGRWAVRLTPTAADRRVVGTMADQRHQYEVDIRVDVDLRTPGDAWTDHAALWAAIEAAVDGNRRALRGAGVGIFDVESTAPAGRGSPGVITITINEED
jgi:hypothetical protein